MVTTTQPEERGRSTAIADGLAFMARWSLRLALIGLGLRAAVVAHRPAVGDRDAGPAGLLITTVLNPPANWMRRRGAPPALAAAVVLVGALLLLARRRLLPGDVHHRWGLRARQRRGRRPAVDPGLALRARRSTSARRSSTRCCSRSRSGCRDSVTTIATGVLTGVGTFASLVVTGLLALVLAFLFVKDGDRFLPWLRRFVGPRAGGHLCVVLGRVWDTLGGFIRGQALVSLADAMLIGAGLLIVGVPLALPLAVLTFIGGFIPIVGAHLRRGGGGAHRAGQQRFHRRADRAGHRAARAAGGGQRPAADPAGQEPEPARRGGAAGRHRRRQPLRHRGAFLAVPIAAAGAVVLRYLFAQVDRVSEDDETDAPADPTAARAAGVPPAPEQPGAGGDVRPGGRRRSPTGAARCPSPARTRRTPSSSSWPTTRTPRLRGAGPARPPTALTHRT